MFRAALGLVGLLGTLAAVPPASAEGNSDYSVLIISRERLEVATSCEIGIYLNDQLSGRLFQSSPPPSICHPARWTSACACCQDRCPAARPVSKTNAAHA